MKSVQLAHILYISRVINNTQYIYNLVALPLPSYIYIYIYSSSGGHLVKHIERTRKDIKHCNAKQYQTHTQTI